MKPIPSDNPIFPITSPRSTQQHKNNTVPSQKHFTDESVLVHRSPLRPIRFPRRLRPHLLHVLQHHVAMSVKGFDAREQFAIVPAADQDLRVVSDGGLEKRQRTVGEFVGFE